MPKLFVALILAVVLVVAGLVLANAAMSQYLTAFIALAALAVSVLSAFKDDVFPFRPRALFDEIVFAVPTAPSHDSPALILPVVLVNQGYGSGVIEGLTLKIESDAQAKVYTPIAEVDYQKFISGKRALHGENIVGAFNLFSLASRESLKKHILFSQEEQSKNYPFSSWSPGKHTFRLFVKHSGAPLPVEVGSVIYEIPEKLLANYKAGVGCSLSPTRELRV